MFFDRGDENPLLFSNYSPVEAPSSPLSSRPKRSAVERSAVQRSFLGNVFRQSLAEWDFLRGCSFFYGLFRTEKTLYRFQRFDSSYIVLKSIRCIIFSAPESPRMTSSNWAASR